MVTMNPNFSGDLHTLAKGRQSPQLPCKREAFCLGFTKFMALVVLEKVLYFLIFSNRPIYSRNFFLPLFSLENIRYRKAFHRRGFWPGFLSVILLVLLLLLLLLLLMLYFSFYSLIILKGNL